MKKINKKMIFLLLTMVLIQAFSLYAGGGGEAGSSGKQRPSLLEPGEYTLPIVREQMTLSLLTQDGLNSVFSLNDNLEIWREIEKRTNIKIDWQCVFGGKDYRQSMYLRVAAGSDLPDLFSTRDQNPLKLYKDKVIIQTTDLVKNYAPNIVRQIKENRQIQAASIAPDGHMYTVIPFAQMASGTTNIGGSFFRMDWVRKLGLKEDPVTKEDYFDMLKAFLTKDPNGNGKQDEIPLIFNHLNFFGFFGTAWDLYLTGASKGWRADKNGKMMYDYVNPRFKELLTYLNKMYNEKILQKEVVVKTNRRNQYIATNRVGMQAGALGHAANRDKLISRAGVDLSLGGHYFGGPPFNEITGQRETNPDVQIKPRWFVISSRCKYPEVAVRWLDYVWGSEEGQILTNFGIKDKTYYIGKDGNRHYTDQVLNNQKGFSPQDALRAVGCLPLTLTYERPDAFHLLWEKNPKIYNMVNETKKFVKRQVAIPTILQDAQDAEDYANIKADVETYREEMYLKFIMGQEPLDKFDEYVEKMLFLGLERLREIQQKNYEKIKSFDWK